jgi:transcriptional regulator with GAF, ATPase, and Fis domain
MSKAKYYVLFILTLLCALYQLLLSFNVVPFFFSGQDLFVFILVLAAFGQLSLILELDRLCKRAGPPEEGMRLKLGTDREPAELIDIDRIEETHLLKYVLNLQRYLKDVRDVKDAINKTLVAAARITRSQRASVLLYDRKGGELYIQKTLGWDSRSLELSAATRIKPGEGIAGRVFIDEKPFVMNQPDDKGEAEPKIKYKSSAFACFPLFSGWEVIGVLNLTEKESGTYSQHEIDMVTFIVHEVSVHLSNPSTTKREKP